MLITNGNICTFDQDNNILKSSAIYIDKGIVQAIGSEHIIRKKYSPKNEIDAKGKWILPSNVCAHTHFYGAYARGIPMIGPPPSAFPEILRDLWWKLDLALDEEAIRYSTQMHLIDAIKHGTTVIFDHHASPNAIDGSLDIIADEVDRFGLRAVLCYEVTDRNGDKGAKAGIKENVRFINKIASMSINNDHVSGMFGLHASLTLSDTTINKCVEENNNLTGFHLHAAEHEIDQQDSLEKSGKRVIQRLYDFGILGDKTIVAHAVHIDDSERVLLADTGTWVSHQPRSNMNNGVGIADVESLLSAGIEVALGNDGFQHGMWDEAKMAYLLQKTGKRDPRAFNADKVMRMLYKTNPKLAKLYFPASTFGTIDVGSSADLIFVDYKEFTPVTPANLPWHLAYGFHESMITTTIAKGKLLMDDRQLIEIDEEKLISDANQYSSIVWGKFAQL